MTNQVPAWVIALHCSGAGAGQWPNQTGAEPLWAMTRAELHRYVFETTARGSWTDRAGLQAQLIDYAYRLSTAQPRQ